MSTHSGADPRPSARIVAAAAVILNAFLLSPSPIAAQGLDVRLRVFGGALDPAGGLSNAHILSSPVNVVSYDQLPTLATAGVGLEVRPTDLPAVLRLSGSRSFAREDVGQWGCADMDGTPLACPSILILVPTDMGSTQLSADALIEAPVGPVVLRPLVGLGWVRYDYEWDPTAVGSFSLEPGTFTDEAWSLRYGVGVAVPAGPVDVELEHVRYRAGSDRRRPDEAAITTVGVSIPLSSRR